jgi:CheY-like chemotaxis protein
MTLSKTVKILLIEDDEGHATLIQLNLQDAGVMNPVVYISDGRAALHYVQQLREAELLQSLLILLDLNLPGVDGFHILEQLKSDQKTQKIPIVILTSTDDPLEINRCYELGCNIFLRKPVEYSSFVHAVRQLGLFLAIVEVPSIHY